MNDRMKAALDAAVASIQGMSPEELRAELEAARNDPLAIALREIDEFGAFVDGRFNDLMQNHLKDVPHFLYGSSVYGTAHEASDMDLIVVVDDPTTWFASLPMEMANALHGHFDVTMYATHSFEGLLHHHHVAAIESVMQEGPFMGKFQFTLDPWKIRASFSATASNSWVKAKKKLTVEESYDPYIGKKSAWHAIRILMFAIQILKLGKIVDFSEANQYYEPIMTCETWEEIDGNYRCLYKQLHSEVRVLAPKESK